MSRSGWKVGMPAWNKTQEYLNYRDYWTKGKYKIVTLEIEGTKWVFRVNVKTDVIWQVIEPKFPGFRGTNSPHWMVGKTVDQFLQVASSPLMITDPAVPPLDFKFGQILSPQFRTVTPAGVRYFEMLAGKIAEYLTTMYEDWMSLDAEARISTEPFQKFAAGLIEGGPNRANLPFVLAQQFLLIAPESLGVSQQNIDRFFKELTQEVYTYAPETSYAKLYESYHDAQQLTNERMRGSLRQAEIREMHESQAGKVVVKHEEMAIETERRTLEIIELMNEELADAIRIARGSDRNTAVQRMERLAATIEMVVDSDSNAMTISKLIAMEPEFSAKIREKSMNLVNWAPEADIEPTERYRVSIKDMRRLDEAKRITDAHDKRRQASNDVIRTLEAEGSMAQMNSVVTNVYPLLSENLSLAEGQFLRETNPEIQAKSRSLTYPPEPRKSQLPMVGGKGMFDKQGMLIAKLRPKSKKFKISKPEMRWGRKLYQGALDINVKIMDFRERDRPHAVNTAMLHHLMERFGGDKNAFGKLQKAVDAGIKVANEYAFYAMLPTFVNMVYAKTQHFQGMDKLKAGKRGVFFELVPPEPRDIRINKGKPFNISFSLHWARITTSRSLQFYRDKEGKPMGERRLRVEQYQQLINAHKARPTAAGKRRAIGRGFGFLKEQRGQQFITQKYLDNRKRSFLERMDKKQHLSSTRQEISALFGDDAGAVVRKAVRSGESVTMALAQHLRAQPGDRIHVYMNNEGEIGTTIEESIKTYTPAPAKAQKFTAVPTSYKRITTLTIPVLRQTEPMEPVSDSFRGAMRAIRQGGYGGNIFQKLANILWNVDVPLPDWNVEELTLSTSQISQVTQYIRDQSNQAETALNQGVAEERVTKKLDERVIGPAVAKILRDPELMSTTERILKSQIEYVAGRAIDNAMIIGWTI